MGKPWKLDWRLPSLFGARCGFRQAWIFGDCEAVVVRFPCILVSLNEVIMLAKRTVKNQITLPKAVVTRFSGVEYFDVSTDGECIVLRPLHRSRAEEVRARLVELGIDEQDVTTAVSWARETK